MRRIALVSCGAAKLDHAAPARELYTSNLFRLAAAYADRHFDRWWVISAFYGLLSPDRIVAPYDVSLEDYSPKGREGWGRWVAAAAVTCDRDAAFTLLAGGHYRVLAEELRGGVYRARGPVHEPLRGLAIGKRMQWLKRELQAVSA
ncbi:MAG: hypothetical protein M3340_08685 [Actinomycetota bacterium]|nr:hypothetical protein [Actinomycetota bacterium]